MRRENLWSAVQSWKATAEELGAEGTLVYALMVRDEGGTTIYQAHRRWFQDVAVRSRS